MKFSVLLLSSLVLISIVGYDNVFAQEPPTDPEPPTDLEPEPEPVDATPPTLNVPESFTVSPDGPLVTTVVFSATAVDDVDGTIVPVCTPASPAYVMIGTTTVTCTATDTAGNVAEASFVITVVDQSPPEVTVPEDIAIDSTVTSDTTITFTATAVDDVDGAIIPECTPESGSKFYVGTTTVICTATDTAGNIGEASFDVTVNNLLTVLDAELLALGELDPSNIENVGTHVSEFVRTSNILFQLEQQGLKDLRTQYRESGMTRNELNQELSQYRITIQDMRQDYQDIFENYRDTVKQLVKEKNGLSVEDKRNLQQLEKAKLRIQHNDIESLDTIDSFIDDSLYQELKINENKLRKLNNLIALSNYPLSVYSDTQVAKWKQEQIELFSTVKALKIVMSGADKDSKSDILSTIKEIKNQIKEEKQKEEKQKENNSKKNSDKGKSGEKSSKSSNKGKKK